MELLAGLHNLTLINKNDAVESREYFPDKHQISKVLLINIVEKEEKLLVVAHQEQEDQFVLELRRDVRVKVIIVLNGLDDTVQVRLADVVNCLVVNFCGQSVVFAHTVDPLEVHRDVLGFEIDDVED